MIYVGPPSKNQLPAKKVLWLIGYESENFGLNVVFDSENFCWKYFLVQPLSGAVLGGKSWALKA